jgi:polar amino acid transport system permease protein
VKRSTKRQIRLGVLYAVLLIVVVLIVLSADWTAIRTSFLNTDTMKELWPDIVLEGAKNTVVYTLVAFVGGLSLALLLALMKMSTVAPYRWLAIGYIEFFRGLPALIVIIAFGLAVPLAFSYNFPFGFVGAGVAALIVVSAAYMAETLRAGIQAVPKGQVEAARSLGMSSGRTTVSIVLPQAFRIVIPPLTNEIVLLIKDTALLAAIGVTAGQRELTTYSRDMMNNFSDATPLLMAAVMYLVITLPMTRLVAALERRQQRAR